MRFVQSEPSGPFELRLPRGELSCWRQQHRQIKHTRKEEERKHVSSQEKMLQICILRIQRERRVATVLANRAGQLSQLGLM